MTAAPRARTIRTTTIGIITGPLPAWSEAMPRIAPEPDHAHPQYRGLSANMLGAWLQFIIRNQRPSVDCSHILTKRGASRHEACVTRAQPIPRMASEARLTKLLRIRLIFRRPEDLS